jgi:uncharacterized membrane protein YeaQ/YmgE (transglycosylase-associated protein family)
MNLLVTIIMGGVIGWLASVLMKTNAQMGILANVVVGIAGSFLGIAIADALTVGPLGQLGGLVMAVVGAAALIALLRALGVFDRLAAAR